LEAKDSGETPTIKWEIVKKCRPYKSGTRRCHVYLPEKICILKAEANCINVNTELMQKCRQSNKFKLSQGKKFIVSICVCVLIFTFGKFFEN